MRLKQYLELVENLLWKWAKESSSRTLLLETGRGGESECNPCFCIWKTEAFQLRDVQWTSWFYWGKGVRSLCAFSPRGWQDRPCTRMLIPSVAEGKTWRPWNIYLSQGGVLAWLYGRRVFGEVWREAIWDQLMVACNPTMRWDRFRAVSMDILVERQGCWFFYYM